MPPRRKHRQGEPDDGPNQRPVAPPSEKRSRRAQASADQQPPVVAPAPLPPAAPVGVPGPSGVQPHTPPGNQMDAVMQQLSTLQAMLLSQQASINELRAARVLNDPPQNPAGGQQRQVVHGYRAAHTEPLQDAHIHTDEEHDLNIPGELDPPSTLPQPRPLVTAGMPLGHSLPQKIKNDIWEDKFVDMAALLYPDTHTTYGVQLTGDVSSEEALSGLKVTQHKKRVRSIAEWSKAFSTFIAVYIQKPGHEGDATDLLTYMAEVQSIAEDGLDWAMYDDMYRRDRCATTNPQSWACINQHIHNAVMRKRANYVAFPSGPAHSRPMHRPFLTQHSTYRHTTDQKPFQRQQNISTPPGYCYDFHTPEKFCSRPRCTFKHKCFQCNTGKTHPAFMCRTKQHQHRQQHAHTNRR